MAHGVPSMQQLSFMYYGMPVPLPQLVKDLITDLKPEVSYASIKPELLHHNTQSVDTAN